MGSKQQLRNKFAHLKESLFKQGYLDEQFNELEELEDSDNPNFLEEIATLFFRDSVRQMNNIEQALEKNPVDFNKLDMHIYQFRGSCSSIGAAKVRDEASRLRDYCQEQNAEGCRKAYQQLKKEHATLKKKLESYFQLMRQAGPAETSSRIDQLMRQAGPAETSSRPK